MLNKNVTPTEARVRYALAISFAATALAPIWGLLPWWSGLVAGVLAVLMIATATTRYCPVYGVLRLRPPRRASDEEGA